MTSSWIIKNAHIITMQKEEVIQQGVIHVEDDIIRYVGKEMPQDLPAHTEIINGSDWLMLPGLINSHNHAAMSLLRGYGDDLALQVWLEEKMWPMEAKFSKSDVRWGAALSIVEMLKGGITTFLDMYHYMDEVASVCEESGIRACLTRGVIGLCSLQEQEEKLAEAITFAKDWHLKADGRIRTFLSPHAPYTCTPALIEKFIQASHDMDLPLHTHMSETLYEVEQNVREYGMRPPLHLQKLGFFDRPSLVAHAVHLNEEEIALLAQHDVKVSHNPGSNLKLASGVANIPEMLKQGVTVSLGTDGPASNNNLDVFEEMRLTALVHKGFTQEPTVLPAYETLKLGTSEGAKALFLDDRVGMLKAGMKADMIALDLKQPYFTPHTNLISHVIYAGNAQDVLHVWVDGKQVVKNRECLTMDEEKICFEAQACLDRLA